MVEWSSGIATKYLLSLAASIVRIQHEHVRKLIATRGRPFFLQQMKLKMLH